MKNDYNKHGFTPEQEEWRRKMSAIIGGGCLVYAIFGALFLVLMFIDRMLQ